MRKILLSSLLLSALCINVNAQILKYVQEKGTFDFGVRAGLATSILISDEFKDQEIRFGIVGGVFSRYAVSERFFLQIDAVLAQRGADFAYIPSSPVGPSPLLTSIYLTAVDFPITAIYNIRYRMMQKDLHFDVFAGIAPGYHLETEVNERDDAGNISEFDLGIVAGSGFTLGKIILYATTKIGLTDIAKDFNPIIGLDTKPVRSISTEWTVSYRF